MNIRVSLLTAVGTVPLLVLAATTSDALRVSALLERASHWDRKSVEVSGKLTIALENCKLCEENAASKTSKCIWFEFDEGPYDTEADKKRFDTRHAYWARYSGKHVAVRGVFHSGPSGHFGMSAGELRKPILLKVQPNESK